MFAISRRAILTPTRSLPRLNPSVCRIPAAFPSHPASLPRTPLSGPQRVQRYFSTSPRLQVQYARFPNGYTYYTRRPNRDRVAKIFVFVTAAGAVYYVAQ